MGLSLSSCGAQLPERLCKEERLEEQISGWAVDSSREGWKKGQIFYLPAFYIVSNVACTGFWSPKQPVRCSPACFLVLHLIRPVACEVPICRS